MEKKVIKQLLKIYDNFICLTSKFTCIVLDMEKNIFLHFYVFISFNLKNKKIQRDITTCYIAVFLMLFFLLVLLLIIYYHQKK
jgi:hypothetical protein